MWHARYSSKVKPQTSQTPQLIGELFLPGKRKKQEERSCAVEPHTVRILTKTVQLSEPTVLRRTGDFIVTSSGEFLV